MVSFIPTISPNEPILPPSRLALAPSIFSLNFFDTQIRAIAPTPEQRAGPDVEAEARSALPSTAAAMEATRSEEEVVTPVSASRVARVARVHL
eukprot:CAMPEP_0182553338 /NCGR_PEP_ID=MMETSP1323-20130603/49431_1 /TAXON_ID=236787 /ORGANISM="Florenciella parvula, Strain RCC1693" /LENGTH=92 /DNA_ID=CAMNT_0024765053 /DNA_START=823 /DNA_END=1103 /DNA_ORIENTATION=+